MTPSREDVLERAKKKFASLKKRSKKLGIDPPFHDDLKAVFLESLERGFECFYCSEVMIAVGGLPPHYIYSASVDHAIPLCAGGKNERDNYRVCCNGCNIMKGTASEGTFGLMVSHVPREVWRAYVEESIGGRLAAKAYQENKEDETEEDESVTESMATS